MEQEQIRTKVLEVLMRNHSMNLFSSFHRDQLADQIVSAVSGKTFSRDGLTDTGYVQADPDSGGTPIMAPKKDVSKKSKSTVEVVNKPKKPTTEMLKQKKAHEEFGKKLRKEKDIKIQKKNVKKPIRPDKPKVPNTVEGKGFKKLKNKI
tara:strand:- start:196 stop:642 length:447 start_codon:yes stop_codon:yes gene_type:complete